MSMTSPSPRPQVPEITQRPQPVVASGQPRKPGLGLTLGLCLIASAVTAAVTLPLANQDPAGASGAGHQVRLAAATVGELVQSLRVGGTIETLNFAAIRAPQMRGPRDSGRADLTLMRLVEPGTIVEAGSVVAEFELKWLVDHIEDRTSVVITAQSDLKKREAEVLILKETERQARVNAEAEFGKATLDLRTAEVRSRIEAEVLKSVSDEARATWQQLEEEGRIKERVHAADIRRQELQVREEVLHNERHLRDLHRLRVRSPIPGMVVLESLFNRSGQFAQTKEGDQVYPGALFMRIVDVSQMVVSATVNQVDAQSIRIGDEAVVELDAYPGERFKGRVVSLGSVASSGSSRSRFSRGSLGTFVKSIPVRISIEDQDERVLPDLSASVDVLVSRRPQGVLVPRESLRHSDGPAATYVYVHSDGQFRRRDVRVEAVSDTEAVIAAGLQAGEEILLGRLPDDAKGD